MNAEPRPKGTSTMSPTDAPRLGVPYGVAVATVDPGSAADQDGLQGLPNGTWDIIIAIDGNPTRTFDDMAGYVDGRKVGDQVMLTVHRNGNDVDLTARLQAWDSAA
jgi:S1-C subfamily serine protease